MNYLIRRYHIASGFTTGWYIIPYKNECLKSAAGAGGEKFVNYYFKTLTHLKRNANKSLLTQISSFHNIVSLKNKLMASALGFESFCSS